MNNLYVLKYWSGNKNDTEGKFMEIKCTIPDEVVDNILSKKPTPFIRGFVNDGEALILPTSNIYDITQVYN